MFIRKITIAPETNANDDYVLSLRVRFGQENLDKAFLLYSIMRERHVDEFELEENFTNELYNKGVPECFTQGRMIHSYCKSRFTTPIKVIDTQESYDDFFSEIRDVKEIKKLIRRLKHQKDRLPLSSLKLRNVEYEIHGRFMNMCLNDVINRLRQLEPECDPDTIVPRGLKAIIREYEVSE
jgi:hypothetical protein